MSVLPEGSLLVSAKVPFLCLLGCRSSRKSGFVLVLVVGAREPFEDESVLSVAVSGEPLSCLCRPVTREKIERLLPVVVSAGDRVEAVSRLCMLPMLGVGLVERVCFMVPDVEAALTEG